MAEPARKWTAAERPTVSPVETEFPGAPAAIDRLRSVRQAHRILRFGFTVAPLVAGFDKFSRVLVNWDDYLAPWVPNITGIAPRTFMMGVGIIEIIAGIGVALKPRIFGNIVGLWLLGIVINLVSQGKYYDIALRDCGLALGAFALARLSTLFDTKRSRRARLVE